MRVLSVVRRRVLSQIPARSVAAESSLDLPETCTHGLQLQQERGFSAPMFRSRGSTAPSPWSLEHGRQATAQLTSSTTSLAASAAWQASVAHAESSQVEDWLAALHQVDAEARGLCTSLLSRHPTLLWKDPQRTTGVVQALVDATRQRHLLRPYYVQDAHILALVDRYTPESLRARLSELHRLVWQKLDDANVAALFAARTSLDLLDLDAKALALKAQALRALVPEFPPSTVLRGCPELLDVQVDDLPAHIRRAGDVVVVGMNAAVELVSVNNVVIVRSRAPVPSAGAAGAAAATATAASPAASPAAATAGRLLRTARCGAQQLLQQERSRGGGAPSETSPREVVRVFCNTRQLVFAAGDTVEVRVEDPGKAQEEISAAGRVAVLQQRMAAAVGGGAQAGNQATAGMRCA